MTGKILVVDDDPNLLELIRMRLESAGYEVAAVRDEEEALALVKAQIFDLCIVDLMLAHGDGVSLMEEFHAINPEVPAIILTAHGSIDNAVEAMRRGAHSYLTKPFEPRDLLMQIERAIQHRRLNSEIKRLKELLEERYDFANIVARSSKMRAVLDMVSRIAKLDSTVYIHGESGTGKELVAKAIHLASDRKDEPFIALNCAALPETLLESELFGHEKGAFTGAVKQKPGRVEEADGGTIFLDEIGDMSRPLQAKLLRFLEDGSFTRVGGNQELKVNVRLIAATNKDIVEAIRQNQFREDLFHRLNVVQFRPPPLRERGSDIVPLADHFLRTFCLTLNKPGKTFSIGARNELMSHHWPGNVRELRNAVERAVILETKDQIQPESLPDFHVEARLNKQPISNLPSAQSLDEAMNHFERELIASSLERHHFSLTKTAEQLRISRHALRYRMNRLNIGTDTLLEEDPPVHPGKEISRI
jgi:two-component system response regulator GlrR